MTGILHLFRRDVRKATSNVMAVILMIGLTVLPSLFTWFNVLASWDPFSNVKDLTVAVANTDEGYRSDLVPVRLNIGDQVVSALRGNDDFNWVITSEDDAVDGTKSGKYYAALVLPKEFSKDMLTFYTSSSTRTDITYYTNEKKNALAPKITGQGVDKVSEGINQVFTKTLSEISVSLLSEISDYLDSADTQAVFTRLESHVGEGATQLRSAATTADAFTSLISSGQTLLTSSTSLIEATGSTFDDASDSVSSGLDAADSLKATVTAATGSMSSALGASSQAWTDLGTSVDNVFGAANTQTASEAAVLSGMVDQVQAQIDAYTDVKNELKQIQADLDADPPAGVSIDLQPAIDLVDGAIAQQQKVQDQITQASDRLTSRNGDVQATHKELSQTISEAKAAVDKLRTEYDTDLKGKFDQLSSTLTDVRTSAASVGADLDEAASGLTSSSGNVQSQLDSAKQATSGLSTTLLKAADTFDKLEDALKEAGESGDLSALKGVLGEDPSLVAASLAAPVGVERHAVFPVSNFGTAMSPLYTMLALWVGALLMSVTIQVAVHDDALPGDEKLRPHQKYLGRYGIFAALGLAQSTLLCFGNIVFVGIQTVHPWLYMLTGWVTSLVFTLTIYTAVVAFGNAGKALCVLLLVVQISTSGAAYPLQLLPGWFQGISAFLPATYAVKSFGAAIAGIYHGDFWRYLGMLVLYILPALLLGLVLRKPLMNFNKNLATALESTKLM